MTMIINRAILPWLPLFLLGIWGTTEEAGIFGAATRIVMLVSFFLVAVNTIMAPKVAELYAHGDIHLIRHVVRKFSFLITIASSPLFILLIVKGDFVMGLFGQAFTDGGDVLAILAFGHAVTAVTGLAGFILMMAGYERDVWTSSLFGVAALIALSLALIPAQGMTGAAIASATALAVANAVSAYLAWHRLRVNVLPF
jgi:O-antigen/teichoic acid export membrane protein